MEVSIRKKLGDFTLDVHVQSDESNLGILGVSGSGKSMTLKCIAGIVKPDEGRIEMGGAVLFDSSKGINVKPQKRRVGYLFQDYALFPAFTAFENIAAGLSHISAAKRRETVRNLMDMFHLEGLENHYPHQLSGGQQQRVALARILACEPSVILLDEPFSALDSHLRLQMQMETMEILKSCQISIMVTHNREEAYSLCNEILVMDDGKVTASGKKEQLFAYPQTMRTAMLVGCKNISKIEKIGDREIRALDWGDLVLHTDKQPDDTARYIGIHANKLVPVWQREGDTDNLLPIRIIDQIETPYERQILVYNAKGNDGDTQSGIWWDYRGNELPDLPDLPEYLYMPPEDLLFLSED